MKLGCWMLGLALILTGCSSENRELKAVMQLRDRLLSSEGCSFQTEVTADYGNSVHTFSMDCEADAAGTLHFVITKPLTISGIQGSISDSGGNIEFEDQMLFFPLLTDDLLVPASAPWIFVKALRSGYITSACTEESLIHVTVNDSYAEDALTLDIWMEESKPIHAEILHDGKRILSLAVKSFVIS